MKVKKVKKPTKTISGVAPVAVMIPPAPCPHGACLFCPTLNAPQSYTPESPAVLRAKSLDYDPYLQTQKRIRMLREMGHPVDKIELIIMGGTFLSLPKEFQFWFVKRCYDAMNESKSLDAKQTKEMMKLLKEYKKTSIKSKELKANFTKVKSEQRGGNVKSTRKLLKRAKSKNEKTKHRCVALCIETRPDYCTISHIDDILEFGATRVELGVQAIDDKIYKLVNRGHSVQDVIDATRRLKQAGFKIGYHLMPGIYGSNPEKDLRMFKEIFKNQHYKPDQIKIYPCQVLTGSKLEEIYWKGGYNPYTKPQVAKLIIEMLKRTPRYCRIMRILREIPLAYLVCGIKHIDMRKDIEEGLRNNMFSDRRSSHGSPKANSGRHNKSKTKEIRKWNLLNWRRRLLATESEKKGWVVKSSKTKWVNIINSDSKQRSKIKEIRFREIGFAIRDNRKIDTNLKLKTTKYKASNGTEYFLEIINKDNLLFGLLRLRLEKNNPTATVRELHVYGPALKLGEEGRLSSHGDDKKGPQHTGLGKQLIKKAEQITKRKMKRKMRIISGVGVRQYYKKLGYKTDKKGIYVEKKLFK
jgi:ELP3 family radical SAM enzyme/protein acetyltransferase